MDGSMAGIIAGSAAVARPARQPLPSASGRWIVALSGRIHNDGAIGREVEASGWPARGELGRDGGKVVLGECLARHAPRSLFERAASDDHLAGRADRDRQLWPALVFQAWLDGRRRRPGVACRRSEHSPLRAIRIEA